MLAVGPAGGAEAAAGALRYFQKAEESESVTHWNVLRQELLEKYFRLLPRYQGVPLVQLKLRRVLFGGFPCYADSPLKTQFDRVLQVSRLLLPLQM